MNKFATNREISRQIQEGRRGAYYHGGRNDLAASQERPRFSYRAVTQYLFARVRDDEFFRLNPAMFIPTVAPSKASKTDPKEAKRISATKEFLSSLRLFPSSPKPLFCSCLETIVKYLRCYELETLIDVFRCLPSSYYQEFHYYCAISPGMDDSTFVQSIFAPLQFIIFPPNVSAATIPLVGEKLLAVGKTAYSDVDWEDVSGFDFIDVRQEVKQLIFNGTDLFVHSLGALESHFPAVQQLNFIKTSFRDETFTWSQLESNSDLISFDRKVVNAFANLKLPNLERLSFMYCSFISAQFLSIFLAIVSRNNELAKNLNSVHVVVDVDDFNDELHLIEQYAAQNISLVIERK